MELWHSTCVGAPDPELFVSGCCEGSETFSERFLAQFVLSELGLKENPTHNNEKLKSMFSKDPQINVP